jgi:hypothetical protein
LASHRDAYFSVPKEPYFWASDYPGLRAHYGFETERAYAELFASAEAQQAACLAEGSTVYLYSTTAIPAIMAATPNARIILALRNPADLVVSYHRTQVVALNEDLANFDMAWQRSLAGSAPAVKPLDDKLVDYPRVGNLGSAVDRLLQYVPRQQIHVVLFEDLQQRPSHVWRQLCQFLELSPDPEPTFIVRNPSTKQYRSAWVRRLTHRPPRVLEQPMRNLRQWSRTTDIRAAKAVKKWMWRPAPRPDALAERRLELMSYFDSEVEKLERRLSLDLRAWRPAGS